MIGTGKFLYHEETLSKTAQRDAIRAAKRLERLWNEQRPDIIDDADGWIVEAAREEADSRFDWQSNYEMHFRYREEIEHLFVERMGGWREIERTIGT